MLRFLDFLLQNLCKNIGFKNSIVLVFETQIELIKKFLFLLVGYYPELNNVQKISLTPLVHVGNQTSFEIVVRNTGEVVLHE